MIKRQAGFTLIELVIVIVILGILAAAALPRFSDLAGDARRSTLEGLAGSMRAAAGIAHATQLAKGLESNIAVTLEGTTINMVNGYPDNAYMSVALTDITGFTFTPPTTSSARFEIRTNCHVLYTEAGGTGSYTVSVESSGCAN